jgi:hypothetical protein
MTGGCRSRRLRLERGLAVQVSGCCQVSTRSLSDNRDAWPGSPASEFTEALPNAAGGVGHGFAAWGSVLKSGVEPCTGCFDIAPAHEAACAGGCCPALLGPIENALVSVCDGWNGNEFTTAVFDGARCVHGKKLMPIIDWLLYEPAPKREFCGLRFANNFGNARGAARSWFAYFDLDEAKRGGLLDLPFPNAKRAGEFTHGQSSGVPAENALDAFEAFAA